jgi:hypothetical protein
MDRMKQRGIEAMVYSHPLGNQGHGLRRAYRLSFFAGRFAGGPETVPPRILYFDRAKSAMPVAEWDGQKVYAMEEDPA